MTQVSEPISEALYDLLVEVRARQDGVYVIDPGALRAERVLRLPRPSVAAPRPAAPAARRGRPREHRRAARRSGARAPGRPSADADAGDDPPSLRRCLACGGLFAPQRRDSHYCYEPACRRRRAALKVARHRARRAEPAWARAEARAVACVRRGAASPEDALRLLVLGLAARELVRAGGAR